MAITPEAQAILSGNENQADTPQANPEQTGTRAVNAVMTPAPEVNAPQATPALPNLGPQQNGPANPSSAAVQHHNKMAALGRLASSLFTGTETSYENDPQTGQVVPVTRKQRPGQIFRNLLGGALMGMAAGEGAHDFAGGAGRGFEAAFQGRQAQDQRAYGRAQQAQVAQQRNTELSQEQQRIDEERKSREAQVAQLNIQNMRADAELNLREQEFVDNRNQREQELQTQLESMGAQQISLPANGRDINGSGPGNGKELMAYVNANGTQNLAAPGFHPVWTFTTDTNGLQFKDGQWEDASGAPVNLEDHTTHTLYQVPDNVWDEPNTAIKTGADLLKLTPHMGNWIDPKAPIRITNGNTLALISRDAQVANDTAESAQRNASANRQNAVARNGGKAGGSNANQVRVLNQQRLIAANELAQATKNYDDNGYAAARKKLDDIDSQLAKLRAGQNNPPQIQVGQRVTLKNNQTVTVTKIHPDGTFDYK